MELLKKFVIVSFPGGKDKQNLLEIIPRNWISSDRKQCYWPIYNSDKNSREFERDVRLCTAPEDTWRMEDICKIYGSSNTFARVGEKLRIYLETSNEEISSSDEPNGKRRKRAPKRYSPVKGKGSKNPRAPSYDSTDCISDKNESEGLEEMPRSESLLMNEGRGCGSMPMKRYSFQSPGAPSQRLRSPYERSPGHSETLSSGIHDNIYVDKDSIFMVRSSSELSKTLEYLVRMVVELQDEVKVLGRKINKLAGNTVEDSTLNPALEELLKIYPLKTWKDFEESERKLKSLSLRQSMMVHLSQYSHSTVQGCVKAMMIKVLDPDFARNLNWAGRGLKTGISHSNLQEVVKGAVKKNQFLKDVPIDKVEKEIKKWLIFSFRLTSPFKKPQAAVRNHPDERSGDKERS